MYQLKPDPQLKQHQALYENGAPKCCPYQQALMMPGTIQGQVSASWRNCGTWCALFQLHKGNEQVKTIVHLSCAAQQTVLQIENEAPETDTILHKP